MTAAAAAAAPKGLERRYPGPSERASSPGPVRACQWLGGASRFGGIAASRRPAAAAAWPRMDHGPPGSAAAAAHWRRRPLTRNHELERDPGRAAGRLRRQTVTQTQARTRRDGPGGSAGWPAPGPPAGGARGGRCEPQYNSLSEIVNAARLTTGCRRSTGSDLDSESEVTSHQSRPATRRRPQGAAACDTSESAEF
jgi:hypothetical protein